MATIESVSPPKTCCSATLKQVICGLTISASMVEVGFVIGWPAVLPDLQNDTASDFNITNNDVKWLGLRTPLPVSSLGIVGMVSNAFSGTLMELLGPRLLLSLLLMPAAGFWLTQCFAPNLAFLYIGRIGGSFIASVFSTLMNPLLAELVEPGLRGMLSCLPELMVASGVLITYVLSNFLPWKIVTGLCAVPFLPLFCLSLMVPESPFWLVRKGKMRAAEDALVRIRDPRKNVKRDELPEIQTSILNNPQTTIRDQMKQLAVGKNLKPVALLMSIVILREFGGQYAVFSYSVYIFQRAGVNLDAFTCTVLVGVVRLLSTLMSAFLVDRVGRKPCLFLTTLLCGISQTTAGAFLMAEVSGAEFVPLVAVLLFVSAYGLGVGPVPWVLLGELLPTPVRSLGASICLFSFSVATFIVGFIFPELMASIGLGGSFLVFAGANFILSIIVIIFLPETRGRTLHQLEELFSSQLSRRPLINVAENEDSIEDPDGC